MARRRPPGIARWPLPRLLYRAKPGDKNSLFKNKYGPRFQPHDVLVLWQEPCRGAQVNRRAGRISATVALTFAKAFSTKNSTRMRSASLQAFVSQSRRKFGAR